MFSANYTWLTPIMTAQDIVARVLCGSGLNNCLCTLAPRLMVVSFGVGGGDSATNIGSRCRNGADSGVNEVDDQAEVWGQRKFHHCWYKSSQSRASVLVLVMELEPRKIVVNGYM